MLIYRYSLVINNKATIGILVGAWAFNLIPPHHKNEYKKLMDQLPNPKLDYEGKQPISYFTREGKQNFSRLIEIIKDGIVYSNQESLMQLREEIEVKDIFSEMIGYEDEYQVIVLKEGRSLINQLLR